MRTLLLAAVVLLLGPGCLLTEAAPKPPPAKATKKPPPAKGTPPAKATKKPPPAKAIETLCEVSIWVWRKPNPAQPAKQIDPTLQLSEYAQFINQKAGSYVSSLNQFYGYDKTFVTIGAKTVMTAFGSQQFLKQFGFQNWAKPVFSKATGSTGNDCTDELYVTVLRLQGKEECGDSKYYQNGANCIYYPPPVKRNPPPKKVVKPPPKKAAPPPKKKSG